MAKQHDKPEHPHGASHPPKEDTRPPVSTPPGGMAKPPGSLGSELERSQQDDRPPVDPNQPTVTLGGTGEGTPDGQQVRTTGPTQQPDRPDQTTQGQRPNVGGSNPIQTHPDNPAMAGAIPVAEHGKAVAAAQFGRPADGDRPREMPEGIGEDPSLLEAKRRAAKEGGNVYRVARTLTSGHTGHVTESDFYDPHSKSFTADIPWLIRSGALEPVGPLKADPKMAHQLGPKGLEEIDRLQARNNELEADNERLEKENADLRQQVSHLRHAHK